MTNDIEYIIACQERLIAALDTRDVDHLEAATVDLDRALNRLQVHGAVHEQAGSQLDFALRQSLAARIRVNVLADWNRQRIDRVAQIRGSNVPTYTNPRGIPAKR